MWRKVGLYARTIPHLKPWQVVGRVVARVRHSAGLSRILEPPAELRGRLKPRVPFPQHEPWNTRADILAGHFCFLNEAEDLGRPVDWKAARMPLLWRFNLHYFQYLHLLERDEQERLCRAWVQANPVGNGVGWHSYPTSLRVVNWCRANVQAQDLQASLYQQAAHLYRNLETYVYGNHLLENARALVYAGCFFGDQGEAPRWLRKGLDLYREQTSEQILPDGAHFERSPMYHSLMLEGYLDVLNLLEEGHPDRAYLLRTANAMTDAAASMSMPDGSWTLFNDATQEIALAPACLLRYAEELTGHVPRPGNSLPEAGYFFHRSDAIYLAIDGGPVGPEYLMAHAHADIFSFELALFEQPFVVDAGVYAYAAGPMRDYIRSTAAHNTVCVDGVDQVECWGSFRVGRRFTPRDVSFTQTGGVTTFEGTFDGYSRLIGDGIVHHRTITVDESKREIRVTDHVGGSGSHRVESRLHLHPEVDVETGSTIRLRRGVSECSLKVIGGNVRWEEGWYCPRFGEKVRNVAAVVGGRVGLPTRFGFVISY